MKTITTILCTLTIAAIPMASSGIKPIRRTNLRAYRFDGVRIGNLYSRLMVRAPYNRPCDNDPIDNKRQRAMVYGGLPCRNHAFPQKTTVIFLLRMSRIRPYHQPIQNIAFLGGRYFKKHSNFPIQPGDTLARARKLLGRPLKSMYIGRRIPLKVTRFKGHIYILTQGPIVRGVVLGPMPWDRNREQWETVSEMYRRYTPQLKNPPPPASPSGLKGVCLRVWKRAVLCRKKSKVAAFLMRKAVGFKRKCEDELRRRSGSATMRCLANASCARMDSCFKR